MEVTESLLDRVPVGNLHVPRAEFGALWVEAERLNREETGVLSQKKRRTRSRSSTPATGDRRVGQPPLVAAVNSQRPRAAAPARCSSGPRTRPDPHCSTDLIDPVDHHTGQVRQQNPNPLTITQREMITRP
jgi:hypothetical protein